MTSGAPEFSIIVPTYNRPTELARCLDVLARLDYPRERFEVIIVDDGSTVSVEPVAEPFRARLDITVRRVPNGGPARARNIGAELARGRYLAFTDDDCMPAACWLRAFETRAAALPRSALGGRTVNALPDNLCSALSHLVAEVAYAVYNANPDDAQFFASNNLAVPAEGFRRLGGFDPAFTTAEDRDLCQRWLESGARLAYAGEAIVYHAHPLTPLGLWRQHFAYGRGAYRFHRRHPRWRRFDEYRRFYWELARRPSSTAGARRALLSALLAVQQVANAAGFLTEMVIRSV